MALNSICFNYYVNVGPGPGVSHLDEVYRTRLRGSTGPQDDRYPTRAIYLLYGVVSSVLKFSYFKIFLSSLFCVMHINNVKCAILLILT